MASSQTQAQVPPDDNHWHNEEDVVITNQAVGLPDVGTFNLYKITSPLKQREEIRKHIKGGGHGALKAAMPSFRTISRRQFSSIEEFITSMKSTYKTLADLKSGIPPYYALQTMLIELMEVPELNSYVVVKDNELNAIENPPSVITVVVFINTVLQSRTISSPPMQTPFGIAGVRSRRG